MYNPENQYRCTIIRGKAQKDLDNLLPNYSSFIDNECPTDKEKFNKNFNDYLSEMFYDKSFNELSNNHKKTVRNHITEIAGKLFGLYYTKGDLVYQSESCLKLVHDNDQPAFFKNLCLNFQFPNGTQKTQTVQERINDNIKFKPFHFIVEILRLSKKIKTTLTKDEVSYYILNSKDVLQGKVSANEVLDKIISLREEGKIKKLESSSYNTQHIREQINLLELSNVIRVQGDLIILNSYEHKTIELFISSLYKPLSFDIYNYDLSIKEQRVKMYEDWDEYYGRINIPNHNLLTTSLESLQKRDFNSEKKEPTSKGVNHNILGDEGEEYVFNIEKQRVSSFNPRLTNKVLMLGKQRGIGYDISSIEANENVQEPEFARFIEVKSTKRTTIPTLDNDDWVDTINLTRREWIAAKQYGTSYNIYRVYFTPNETIVRIINNPYEKNEKGKINVTPTTYRMDFFSKSIDKEY